jgi:hypothetical protein
VVELLRHTLSEEITLDVRVGGGLLWTVIDPNQLEAALLSLVVHARDTMPAGGTLSIQTAEATESPAPVGGDAAMDASRSGYFVMISVGYTGADPDAGTQAFGPQAVRDFIEQSGGVLAGGAEGSGGTAVRLCLPRRAG